VGIGLKAALRLRKLLILRTGEMVKSRKFVEPRYTPGTRSADANERKGSQR
jgi:hypothetical protein